MYLAVLCTLCSTVSRFAPPQARVALNDGSSSYDASLLHFLLSPPLCPQMKDSRGFLGLGERQAPRVPQGKEDCLTLAVHTPSLRPARLLPVVVFIHGGAFVYGSYASIGPQHLLDEVTFQPVVTETSSPPGRGAGDALLQAGFPGLLVPGPAIGTWQCGTPGPGDVST